MSTPGGNSKVPSDTNPSTTFRVIRFWVVLFLAITCVVMVSVHVSFLNGPSYWKWQWRQLPSLTTYGPMLLATIPLLVAQIIDRRARWRRIGAIALLVLVSFGMRVASAYARPDRAAFGVIPAIVQDPHMTSYYVDAIPLSNYSLREWITSYPQLMGSLNLHSMTKPPGPVFCWWVLIRLSGATSETAMIGGLLLGLIAAMGVAATYLMLRALLNDPDVAFCGASFLAICPGFVLFFPMFDPAYVLLSTAMIGCWYGAVRDERAIGSILLGLALTAALFICFSTLVIGTFMICLPWVARTRSIREQLRIVTKHAVIALMVMLTALIFLWVCTGYDPIATFASAWRNQKALVTAHAAERPYPATILFDLTDFALGSGWIGFALTAAYFFRPAVQRKLDALVLLALAQFVLIAVTGLLQSETARVWNFMLPLLMIPVGLELSRWPTHARIACLAALALLTAAIHQNMGFLY